GGEAVEIRHREVRQHHVEGTAVQGGQELAPGVDTHDPGLEPGALEGARDELAVELVVLQVEHAQRLILIHAHLREATGGGNPPPGAAARASPTALRTSSIANGLKTTGAPVRSRKALVSGATVSPVTNTNRSASAGCTRARVRYSPGPSRPGILTSETIRS